MSDSVNVNTRKVVKIDFTGGKHAFRVVHTYSQTNVESLLCEECEYYGISSLDCRFTLNGRDFGRDFNGLVGAKVQDLPKDSQWGVPYIVVHCP
jgi:hypothetical protein